MRLPLLLLLAVPSIAGCHTLDIGADDDRDLALHANAPDDLRASDDPRAADDPRAPDDLSSPRDLPSPPDLAAPGDLASPPDLVMLVDPWMISNCADWKVMPVTVDF